MKTKNTRRRLFVSFMVWAIALGFLIQATASPAVLADDPVPGGSADATTTCGPTAVYCDADVYNMLLSFTLDVEDGDDVLYSLDAEWYDYRELSSPDAWHHFTVSVQYPGRPTVASQKWEKTTGGQTGSETLELIIYDVDLYVTVYVLFHATIDVNHGDCEDWDSEGGYQYYG